jgi:hypothetical protein
MVLQCGTVQVCVMPSVPIGNVTSLHLAPLVTSTCMLITCCHASCVSCPQTRNDAIADTLDLARRRIKKLEDARCNAELKLETSEVGGEAAAPGCLFS